MSDIPADIMEAAERAVDEADFRIMPTDRVTAVAGAILAERERCAKIADEHANRYRRVAAWGDFAPPCEGIAIAIRKGGA